MQRLLNLKELVKSYEKKQVVSGMTFDVREGEILGFLGPNGAGKSTTIRLIAGIETYDSGSIQYQNDNLDHSRQRIRRDLGVVPQEIAVYMDMSAYENVRFFCSLYGFKGNELRNRVKEALEFVGLWEKKGDKPGTFSGGMKRRLNIACSIAHSPKLLIMDEPTVGIDPQSRNQIMQTIRELNRRKTTVIYVSHYMEEVETLCDRIIIADHGKVVEEGKIDALIKKYQDKGCNTLEDVFLEITGCALRDYEEA